MEWSVKDYLVNFRLLENPTETDLFVAVLNGLSGYGFEYGYDEREDARSLRNGIEAMRVFLEE